MTGATLALINAHKNNTSGQRQSRAIACSELSNGGNVGNVVSIAAAAQIDRAMYAKTEEPILKRRGGGGTSDGMDGRVSKLKAHMEHTREDIRDIKNILGNMSELLQDMPNKRDLTSWKLQWTGLGLALVAIVIGGIIGGLAWVQPSSSPAVSPQPIVITLPKN